MTKVAVTFDIEGDEPEHSSGLSGEQYDEITQAIMELGGQDIRFNVEQDDV
jgi:hypothetical protein